MDSEIKDYIDKAIDDVKVELRSIIHNTYNDLLQLLTDVGKLKTDLADKKKVEKMRDDMLTLVEKVSNDNVEGLKGLGGALGLVEKKVDYVIDYLGIDRSNPPRKTPPEPI